MTPEPHLSVVVPLHDEEGNVGPLVEGLARALDPLGIAYEVLLVDDGSQDATAARMGAAAQADGRVRPIYLARNYGQSTALQAGFDSVAGRLVATLDGDLQNDPLDLPAMIRLVETEGIDVATGWRRDRRDPAFRKLLSRIANALVARVTGLRIRDTGCSLRVYRRDALARVRLQGEMHRFLPALLYETGASIREVEVRHHPRELGRSKYHADRAMRVALDLLLLVFYRKYVQRPLHLFGGAGFACLLPGVGILGYLAIRKLALGEEIGGRPLLMLGVLLMLTGVTLIGQGLLGEILSRMIHDTGRRAQYFTRPGPPSDRPPAPPPPTA